MSSQRATSPVRWRRRLRRGPLREGGSKQTLDARWLLTRRCSNPIDLSSLVALSRRSRATMAAGCRAHGRRVPQLGQEARRRQGHAPDALLTLGNVARDDESRATGSASETVPPCASARARARRRVSLRSAHTRTAALAARLRTPSRCSERVVRRVPARRGGRRGAVEDGEGPEPSCTRRCSCCSAARTTTRCARPTCSSCAAATGCAPRDDRRRALHGEQAARDRRRPRGGGGPARGLEQRDVAVRHEKPLASSAGCCAVSRTPTRTSRRDTPKKPRAPFLSARERSLSLSARYTRARGLPRRPRTASISSRRA